MPRLSRWYVRTAFAYLILGFTFGALMLANKGVPLHPALWRLLPAHIELLLIGWVLQFALGVAFWMMPRFWHGPPRGSIAGARVAFFLLNLGIWLVIFGIVLGAPAVIVTLGRLLELGAVVAYVSHIWPRIVPRL
jgi:hypothetical protein